MSGLRWRPTGSCWKAEWVLRNSKNEKVGVVTRSYQKGWVLTLLDGGESVFPRKRDVVDYLESHV